MNIPSVPTDNLYKFIAITGLLLIIFGTYFYQDSLKTIYNEADKVDLEYEKAKIKNPLFNKEILVTDTFSREQLRDFKIDSISIIKRYKKLESRVDSLKNNLLSYFITIIIGIIVSLIGFYFWYNNLQVFQDKIIKNEASKLNDDKHLNIHKVQFEKEFEVYESLWIPLAELKQEVMRMNSVIQEYIDSDELKRGEIVKNTKESYNVFWGHYNEFKQKVESKRPFIPQSIFNSIDSLLDLSIRLFVYKDNVDFLINISEKIGLELNINARFDTFIKLIDEICDAIRKRIELIELKE